MKKNTPIAVIFTLMLLAMGGCGGSSSSSSSSDDPGTPPDPNTDTGTDTETDVSATLILGNNPTITTTNLFASGGRVAALGTVTDSDSVAWVVPADVLYTDDSMPFASDLYNSYVTGHSYASATNAVAALDDSDIIEIDSNGEVVTAYVFADNYFEMYINGTAVGKDPVPFTEFNSNIVRFKVNRPFTVAMLLVDWEENLGSGTEANGGNDYHPGDGGLVAVFKDSSDEIIGITDSTWKAQTYYTAPISDTSCLSTSNNSRLSTGCSTDAPSSLDSVYGAHWARPDNWMTESFNDSGWPSASTYTNDTVGVDNKASYTNFTDIFDDATSDAQFIWSTNLVLDNEILVRATIEEDASTDFVLTSDALKSDFILPLSALCDGKDGGAMIPLSWSNVPTGTGSLALTMVTYPNPDDEGDLSKASGQIVIYDIPSDTTSLAEGQTSVGTLGISDADEQEYHPPCSADATENTYTITLYAISDDVDSLGLTASSTDVEALDTAITSTILDTAVLDLTRIRYNPMNTDHIPTSVPSTCTTKTAAFAPYSELVSVSCSDTDMTITSATGLAYRSNLDGDKSNVGIQSWIGRVPVEEETSWTFPLQPIYISSVTSNINVHNPIGISVDGVPILHYAKETDSGETAQVGTDYSDRDTMLLGEVDQCGAHAGNGEDYHYHSAPFCLMDTHDPSLPLAYMFDGIPIYFGTAGGVLTGGTGTDYGAGRYDELNYLPADVQDGTNPLDECNAYDINGDGTEYIYYSSSTAPYSIGCFRGEADQAGTAYTYPQWSEDRDLSWSGSDVSLTDDGTMTFDGDTWSFIEVTPGDSNNSISDGDVALIMYRQLVEADADYSADDNCYTFRYRLDNTDTTGSSDTVSTHCR